MKKRSGIFRTLRLWWKYFIFSSRIDPGSWNIYRATNFVYIFGFTAHITYFVAIFVWLGIVPMILYNLLISCPIFIVAFYINRKGEHLWAAFIASAEVIIHAYLASLFIGWGSGFHFYLLIIIPFIYFLPIISNYTKNIIIFALFALYVGLIVIGKDIQPPENVRDWMIGFVNIFNMAGLFIGLTFFGINYHRAAKESEARLVEEKNKLKIRNELMETELEMARKIQMKLIPEISPAPNISFYYKPMEAVGGDFYDFVQFQDPDLLGVFISDVSGHGVPAAFITSMIKSTILQACPFISSPAETLTYFNDVLFHQTNGNFITAFYGIYNRQTRSFVYANAGHNAPYLIRKDRVNQLKSAPSGIPLAVLSNREMNEIGKRYCDSTVELKLTDKLILYTDGLVETVNTLDKIVNPHTPDFETAGIENVMKEIRHLKASRFVEEISERLIKFRGDDHFDDDVCIICMDVL